MSSGNSGNNNNKKRCSFEIYAPTEEEQVRGEAIEAKKQFSAMYEFADIIESLEELKVDLDKNKDIASKLEHKMPATDEDGGHSHSLAQTANHLTYKASKNVDDAIFRIKEAYDHIGKAKSKIAACANYWKKTKTD